MPPKIVIKKIYRKIRTPIYDILSEYKDILFDTHIKSNQPIIHTSYIPISSLDIKKINKKTAEYLADMYLAHRFDLLGTGWITNSYNSKPIGLENFKYNMNVKFNIKENLLPAHYKKAQQIYSLTDKDYSPIDWQKDYKSGYRWNQKNWYKRQRDGIAKGADIKIPWELARLQHLPQLAIFAIILPRKKNKFIREFRNQILDFIANNPPKIGVNWTCTMDIGIRSANMLIAYDLFTQLDDFGILDKNFKQIFANSIYEHSHHIIHNLEYDEYLTSNHYLADITGLLFCCSYLNPNNRIIRWLDFAVSELINEIDKQFNNDGSNFEASTSYHRLSGELAIYSIALILSLPKETIIKLKKSKAILSRNNTISLPDWLIERLFKIGRFTADITKPNDNIPQIGDNDSGRLFRFSPNGHFLSAAQAERKYHNLNAYTQHICSEDELFWDENIINHHTFIANFAGIFDYPTFERSADMFPFEKSIIQTLAKGVKFPILQNTYKTPVIHNINVPNTIFKFRKEMIFEFPNNNLIADLNFISYPDFGLYIFKSKSLYLCIMAGGIGQNGNGGHAHNDKLSFELNIAGKDIIIDAGCYLYTSLIEKRNEFRSVHSHNVAIVDEQEQCHWHPTNKGWFSMINEIDCKVISVTTNEIEFYAQYRDIRQKRRFIIDKHQLTIIDFANKPFRQNIARKFSPGYGKLITKNFSI